jgi:hypothetical protein
MERDENLGYGLPNDPLVQHKRQLLLQTTLYGQQNTEPCIIVYNISNFFS